MFTVGLSLNNAIVRILGTITAGLMTLALLGLFGQDRWLYVLTLSIWMGICTYMMGGKKFEGYWMMAGFATAIVAVDAGLDAVDTFETVMLTLWLCYLALFYFNPMPGGGNHGGHGGSVGHGHFPCSPVAHQDVPARARKL